MNQEPQTTTTEHGLHLGIDGKVDPGCSKEMLRKLEPALPTQMFTATAISGNGHVSGEMAHSGITGAVQATDTAAPTAWAITNGAAAIVTDTAVNAVITTTFTGVIAQQAAAGDAVYTLGVAEPKMRRPARKPHMVGEDHRKGSPSVKTPLAIMEIVPSVVHTIHQPCATNTTVPIAGSSAATVELSESVMTRKKPLDPAVEKRTLGASIILKTYANRDKNRVEKAQPLKKLLSQVTGLAGRILGGNRGVVS